MLKLVRQLLKDKLAMFQAVTVNHAMVNGIVTNWLHSVLNAFEFTVTINILYTVCIVLGVLIQPTTVSVCNNPSKMD